MSHGVWGTPLFPPGAWGEGGLRVSASAAVAMNPRWMDGWMAFLFQISNFSQKR